MRDRLTVSRDSRGCRTPLNGVAVAAKIAFLAAAFAAVLTVYLMTSHVHSGSVDCGKLADYETTAYLTGDLPIPAELASCEPALRSRSSNLGTAFNLTGILFVAAIAVSALTKLLFRAGTAAAMTLRERRIDKIRLGNDIKVVLPGDDHNGRIGRVVESLHSSEEFDAVVTFDEATGDIFAYKYSELRAITVRG